MEKFNIERKIWTICLLVAFSSLTYQMGCTYGERGSLTVYCINATTVYFKLTPYRFDHLDETLKCVNCTLTTLGLGTFDISGNQIKTLDIRNSSITSVWYKAFIGLIFMEKLLLSNNPIENIFPGAFTGVRKVKYLELENAISHLEDDVFQELHLLEVLMLSKNKLSRLSDGVFNGLYNLKILDLSSSNLVSISNLTFSPLVALRSLQLQNNKLNRITGNEFSNLKQLLLLNLENNALTNFTINLDIDNHLRILNLRKNRLTSNGIKTGTFQSLNNLEELYLSHNMFKTIPPKFFQGLFRLRILDLNNNQLKVFTTGTFSGLPHLLALNISDNNLETARVSGKLLLHSMHTLDLSNNQITKFNYLEFMSTMPRITTIYLNNNYLPCETMSELELLFNDDHQRFFVSSNYSTTGECKRTQLTAEQIITKLIREDSESEDTSRGTTAWVILLVIIVHLVAILFYVQFFVLYKNRSQFSFSVLRRQTINS